MGRARLLPRDVPAARAMLVERGTLRNTPPAFQEALLDLCSWHRVAPGEAIVTADDDSRDCFGLATGAAAFTTALSVPDAPLMHIVHPGVWVGYLPLLTGARRNGNVVARMPCVVAQAPSRPLDAMLASRPEWWRWIGVMALDYGNQATGVAADLTITDSRRRCLAVLLRMAGARVGPIPATPPVALVNQEEIGATANLSRNSVSLVMRRAEAEGLVKVHYRAIVITNVGAVRAIVDDD